MPSPPHRTLAASTSSSKTPPTSSTPNSTTTAAPAIRIGSASPTLRTYSRLSSHHVPNRLPRRNDNSRGADILVCHNRLASTPTELLNVRQLKGDLSQPNHRLARTSAGLGDEHLRDRRSIRCLHVRLCVPKT